MRSTLNFSSIYHAKALKILTSWYINIYNTGLAWGLMPVIPALWEADVGGSLEVRIRGQPGQHGKTLSLLKLQKLLSMVVGTCSPNYSGG